MSDFDKSLWSDPAFSREYLDNAQAYIPMRWTMLSVLVSFYRYFLGDKESPRVLDLGCGDGVVADALLASNQDARMTLVDGSADMLRKAAQRFPGGNVRLIEASFQALIEGDLLTEGGFDLVVSSLAIHHLGWEGKRDLYGYLFDRLSPGGYLVHLDVVLGPSAELEGWSMSLWQDWVDRQREAGLTNQDFSDITRRYKDNDDNRPDTLALQLDALRNRGYDQVDCLFKYGAFAIWAARRPD
jgi:tRNA (cmo5U34)-methyltransferase